MKKIFLGHFDISEEDKKNLWEECLFVVDTNILLNLYRYSDPTRNEYFEIMKSLGKRLWVPHKVAEEYLSNRLLVIESQEKTYNNTLTIIDKLENTLKNKQQHPFINEQLMKESSAIFDKIKFELKENKRILSNRITNDNIKSTISNLFDDKVGSSYDEDKIKIIIAEGKKRYDQNIPPGYKDKDKFKDSDIFIEKCKKYGDYIIWEQLIDKSILVEKSIIFVTDDVKEDWWYIFKGKKLSARPELIEEFYNRTNKIFKMYRSDTFIEYATKFLDKTVNPNTVKEIRELRLIEDQAEKLIEREKYANTLSQLRNEKKELQRKIKLIYEEIKSIKYELNELKNIPPEHRDPDGSEMEDYIYLNRRNAILSEEYSYLNRTMQVINSNINKISYKINNVEQNLI